MRLRQSRRSIHLLQRRLLGPVLAAGSPARPRPANTSRRMHPHHGRHRLRNERRHRHHRRRQHLQGRSRLRPPPHASLLHPQPQLHSYRPRRTDESRHLRHHEPHHGAILLRLRRQHQRLPLRRAHEKPHRRRTHSRQKPTGLRGSLQHHVDRHLGTQHPHRLRQTRRLDGTHDRAFHRCLDPRTPRLLPRRRLSPLLPPRHEKRTAQVRPLRQKCMEHPCRRQNRPPAGRRRPAGSPPMDARDRTAADHQPVGRHP